MYFKSKKISLLILGVTAMVSSRTMLVSLDDPEGPNLLIVTVFAGVIFGLSLVCYGSSRFVSPSGLSRILVAVALQILIVVTLYFFLQTKLPENREGNSIEDIPVAVVENEKSDLIRVTSPRAQAAIGNPVTVSGEARGYWFFEGSFPLIVVDWDGKIIGEGYATAVGDWMTESFVPFTGTITYKLPEDTPYTRGAIIFRKDNPSGLPEHDDALEIPINFGDTQIIQKSEQHGQVANFIWRYEIIDEIADIPKSRVIIETVYADSTRKETLVATVDGSCNEMPTDTKLALNSEQLLCYYAGFGYQFRVIEAGDAYLLQQKEIEEASPDYNPPIAEFKTVLNIPKVQ